MLESGPRDKRERMRKRVAAERQGIALREGSQPVRHSVRARIGSAWCRELQHEKILSCTSKQAETGAGDAIGFNESSRGSVGPAESVGHDAACEQRVVVIKAASAGI